MREDKILEGDRIGYVCLNSINPIVCDVRYFRALKLQETVKSALTSHYSLRSQKLLHQTATYQTCAFSRGFTHVSVIVFF